MSIPFERTWKDVLKDEFQKEYFQRLWGTVGEAYRSPQTKVFPPQEQIFNAFNHCPFDTVKVVILGQDPYHKKGQAHGLAFSVLDGVPIPPSLCNIFKEMNTTINFEINCGIHQSGNLERWADQGVLLLNSVLTVEEGNAGSHAGIGWEHFTDAVIQKISKEKEHIIFLLWGAYAQEKGKHIDTTKHLVLTAPHPSPLSAYKGFLGCGHFRTVNEYLDTYGVKAIDW